MDFTVNLSGLHPSLRQAICKGLQHEDRARYVAGAIEQARLKKMMDQAAVPGFNTELGRTSMVISEDQAQRARRMYGQLCFADPAFGKWLLKHNPEMRVKDVGTRIQSGYTGRGRRKR